MAGDELTPFGKGIAGLHRSTLVQLASSLARPLLAERGLAPLSRLSLEAVAARVVHAACNDQELEYFGPVATLPGFARALARTLSELRLAGVSPQDLAKPHSKRCSDLGRLLQRYEDELNAGSLADLGTIFELAAGRMGEDSSGMLSLPVLLLDAPLETHAHREFFAKLAARAPEVLAAVSSGEEDLEAILDCKVEDLDAESPSSTPLDHLRQYLFSPSPPPSADAAGFEIFSAPGEGLEAVEIARRILRLAKEGIGLDQIAVLLRIPERYQPMMEEALRRASLPAYFSHGTARPDPAGRAFLALLACASEKCSASRFAEYLSLGQTPALDKTGAPRNPGEAEPRWAGPEDELLGGPAAEPPQSEIPEESHLRTPSGWEKLLVDAAVIGGRDRWARRLKGLEREFELRLASLAEQDDAQQDYLSAQLERLRDLARFALPLIEVLDTLRQPRSWAEWLDSLARLAEMSLRNPDPVLTVLADLEPMGEVGPVTVDEVAEVLSERLRFLRSEPPHRRWGRVFVGSIEEARGREFAIVFLPGLAEGLFPQRALEDPLLLDRDRRELSSALPTRADRNAEERERLHLAVAAARDRFISSYPRMDVAEARPRVPSFYALELPRALEGTLPNLETFEQRARESAPARLNWPAPRNVADAIDDAEYDIAMLPAAQHQRSGARYLMETNACLARSLRTRFYRWEKEWRPADGLIVRDPQTLRALEEHRLKARAWSPSSLEQFAVCPYKFALHGIHVLHPREDAAPLQYLDPRTRGSLFHEIQRVLLRELKNDGMLPLDPARLADAIQACDRTLDRVARQYEEDLAPAIPRVWRSEIEDMRTDLRGWLQHVAHNDAGWEPMYFEFAFGLQNRGDRDPASVESEAAFEDGLRLRGSIDLIEKDPISGALRITDHKTGKPPERIPAYVGGGRVLQPVMYSMAAEQILRAKVQTARLFYATQRGGYQHVLIPLNGRSRQFLARVLEDIDAAIASGFLPPVPEKDACKFCDYRPVCGPYEELRTARIKDRREERLDGLNEIRGFA